MMSENNNENQDLEVPDVQMAMWGCEEFEEPFPQNPSTNCELSDKEFRADCPVGNQCHLKEDTCEKGINDIMKLLNSLNLDSGRQRPQLSDEQRKEIVAGMQKIKEEVCEKETGDGIMKAYMSAINDLVDEVKNLLDVVNALISDNEMTDESNMAFVALQLADDVVLKFDD
ncbi:hypothetical protein FO519_007478 [Halicephalobus sp. NKZ332]|nr:hypothetical protein FO519_007478 [Halicephalobus sp. NKZ332]